MKGKVIFFDIGHTLVTGADLSPRRLLGSRLMLSEKQTKLVGQLIMTHASTDPDSLLHAMREVLPHRDPEEMREVLGAVWEEQITCVREIGGATSLLEVLKASGYKLGIISNIWHPFYEGFRCTCDRLLSFIDYRLLSYRVGCKKPCSDLYRKAVQETGESAESCWMVGDSYELDIWPASQVGMNTIWVLSRPEKEKLLLARVLRDEMPPPTWTVSGLQDVSDFFVETER